jgi:hypothetical protein
VFNVLVKEKRERKIASKGGEIVVGIGSSTRETGILYICAVASIPTMSVILLTSSQNLIPAKTCYSIIGWGVNASSNRAGQERSHPRKIARRCHRCILNMSEQTRHVALLESRCQRTDLSPFFAPPE